MRRRNLHHVSRRRRLGRWRHRRSSRRVPIIGWLGAGSPEPFSDDVAAFRRGVTEMEFVEGKTVAIEISLGGGSIRSLAGLGAPSWFATTYNVVSVVEIWP